MNNKNNGFIAINIIYTSFILLIVVLLLIMYAYISDRKQSTKIKDDIKNQINLDTININLSENGSNKPNTSYNITVNAKSINSNITKIYYIWSLNSKDEPNILIENNTSVSSPTETGSYYLIVKACNKKNQCNTKVSDTFNIG